MVVVALGADIMALNIKRIAIANEIPIIESPSLARALYYNSNLGDEIPAGLYLAVAQILAYVFQLRMYETSGGIKPAQPEGITVPPEFRHDD